MLLVKIMSSEDTADSDTRKSFALHAGVKSVVFERLPAYDEPGVPSMPERPWLTLLFDGADKESFEPRGNVYVMNERGQTVSSFGVAPIVYADETAEPPKA